VRLSSDVGSGQAVKQTILIDVPNNTLERSMPVDLESAFVVGISSRALFDLAAEQEIFAKDGIEAYTQYQLEHENDLLEPGTGFPLVEAMLNLNTRAKLQRQIIVVVMSKNNAETSIRISKSIKHYNLDIIRGAYTSGEPLHRYLGAFHVDLFLSASKTDVQSASDAGFAAGLIYPYRREDNLPCEGLRIAFDGDAVLFSDESERIYKTQGLEGFMANETANVHQPLPDGPLANLFRKIADLQLQSAAGGKPLIRTALITARNAPADERVIRTLRNWKVRIDEVFFMGGAPKAPVLKAFAPHIFFDDQALHCEPASEVVPTAQVLVSSATPSQGNLNFEVPLVEITAEVNPQKKQVVSVPAIVIPLNAERSATGTT
jgi:5'-nucleotidase